MDLELAGRCFVVTGGTSGLGFAGARALVDEGAKVIIVGRDLERAATASEQLGPNATAIIGDLADPSTTTSAITAATSSGLPVGGGLISVGGPPPTTPMTATDAQWRSAFESVFIGAVRIVRALASIKPEKQAPGMSIAMVLSTSAKSPISGLAISNGLRPGLEMFVKDMADTLGPSGIRVNSILPGRIDTPRSRSLEASAPDPAAARSQAESVIPLRRFGQPEEFGALAAFLLSPKASYITGAAIAVDGGSLRAL